MEKMFILKDFVYQILRLALYTYLFFLISKPILAVFLLILLVEFEKFLAYKIFKYQDRESKQF